LGGKNSNETFRSEPDWRDKRLIGAGIQVTLVRILMD
jgi:hypothetical protein